MLVFKRCLSLVILGLGCIAGAQVFGMDPSYSTVSTGEKIASLVGRNENTKALDSADNEWNEWADLLEIVAAQAKTPARLNHVRTCLWGGLTVGIGCTVILWPLAFLSGPACYDRNHYAHAFDSMLFVARSHAQLLKTPRDRGDVDGIINTLRKNPNTHQKATEYLTSAIAFAILRVHSALPSNADFFAGADKPIDIFTPIRLAYNRFLDQSSLLDYTPSTYEEIQMAAASIVEQGQLFIWKQP